MAKDYVEHRVVMGFISTPADEAEGLAKKLVESGLVACAQVTAGITSYYRWEGEVQRDAEVLIIIKSKLSLQQAIADFVENEHSYDVPECVFVPAVGGVPAYLQWVGESTK